MGLILKNIFSKEDENIADAPDQSQAIDDLLQKYQLAKTLYDDGNSVANSAANDAPASAANSVAGSEPDAPDGTGLDSASMSGGLIGGAMFADSDTGAGPMQDTSMLPMSMVAGNAAGTSNGFGVARQNNSQPDAPTAAGGDANKAVAALRGRVSNDDAVPAYANADALDGLYSQAEASADANREMNRYAAQEDDRLNDEHRQAMAVINKRRPEAFEPAEVPPKGPTLRDFDPDGQWDGAEAGLGELEDGDQLAAAGNRLKKATTAPLSAEKQEQIRLRAAERLAEDRESLKNPKVRAFLDTVAETEGGEYHFKYGAVKGLENDPWRFTDESTHPGWGRGGKRSPAGRYQMTIGTWREHKNKVGLDDFSPATQDVLAIEELRSAKALDAVKAGHFDAAVLEIDKKNKRASGKWESLPSSKASPQYKKSLDIYRQKLRENGVPDQ